MEIIMRSKLACYCVVRVHFQCLNCSTEQRKKTHTHPRVWCKMMDKVRPRADYTDWMIERESERRLCIYRYMFKITACFLSIITSYNSNTLEPFFKNTCIAEDVLANGAQHIITHTHTSIFNLSIHPHTNTHIHLHTKRRTFVLSTCSSLQFDMHCFAFH